MSGVLRHCLFLPLARPERLAKEKTGGLKWERNTCAPVPIAKLGQAGFDVHVSAINFTLRYLVLRV